MKTSKVDNDYARLGSLSGLSNLPAERRESMDDHGESVISSLSSHSQDTSPSHTNLEHHPRGRFSSYESYEDPTLNPSVDASRDEEMDEALEFTRERFVRLETAIETEVFDFIFCSSKIRGSHFKEKVKVTSTLSQGSIFKDHTYAIQTLDFHEGAIWTMKFSPTGAHLCSAGQDGNVVVWLVGGGRPYSGQHGKLPGGEDTEGCNTAVGCDTATVKDVPELSHFIIPEPYRVLEGHASDVVDLAWSKLEFLLSASTDKTVRLWHVRTSECLQYFRHPDIVTAVAFHPLQDRYFISGCFDRKLRVWDVIPDPTVLEWTQTTDTITSVCFSPDGKLVAGGMIQGKVYFYDLIDYDQLKYKTQMECRNRSGKFSGGTKVTGMCYQPNHQDQGGAGSSSSAPPSLGFASFGNAPPAGTRSSKEREPSGSAVASGSGRSGRRGAQSLLVTTNDSRIRLCSLKDYTVERKFKGLSNTSMQIRASFSADGRYVICGSEAGTVHVWGVEAEAASMVASMMGKRSDRTKECEAFEVAPTGAGSGSGATEVAATAALFAPVEALPRYLARHAHLLPQPTTGCTVQPGVSNSPDSSKSKAAESLVEQGPDNSAGISRDFETPMSLRIDDMKHYSTRVVVTSDYEGRIRVFFRLG